nr:putative capsid protein [Crucivirus sp.]
MSKSKNSVKRQPRRPVSTKQLVVIEPERKNRKVARKTYKSYARAEKAPGALSGLGRFAGGALGSTFGPAGTGVGSFLGGKLGHLIETVTGFGDYKVEQNSIMKGGMTVPQIVNSAETGGVIIRHREFIADIPATTAFTVQTFTIQPGLAHTFPWLSQIANSFEQYRMRGMLFEFNSTSSDAVLSTATSTALGSVIMMTDYDVADAPPTGKRQMLNSEYASSSKPSCTFIHPIECKKSMTPQTMMYTRGSIAPPPGFDPRLYDFANFHIATEGMQIPPATPAGIIGELWVTYELEFFKPQFSFYGPTDHFRFNTITAARPFGTVVGSNIKNGGTIGGSISGSALDYSFPPEVSSGKYLVVYSVLGAATALAVAPDLTIVNGVLDAYWANDVLAWLNAPEPAATSATTAIYGTVEVRAQNCSIHLDVSGNPPTANNGDWWVVRISDSISFNIN